MPDRHIGGAIVFSLRLCVIDWGGSAGLGAGAGRGGLVGAWRGALENAKMQNEIIFPDSRDPIGSNKLQTLTFARLLTKNIMTYVNDRGCEDESCIGKVTVMQSITKLLKV